MAPGTVERRPDDVPVDLGRRPRAGDEAVTERSGEDTEPVADLSIGAAHEAGRERVLLEAWIAGRRLRGLLERRRVRRREIDLCLNRFRHDGLTVAHDDASAVTLDGQRPAEWRRSAQGHLSGAVQEIGDQTARIASVRRAGGPVEAGVDDELVHSR